MEEVYDPEDYAATERINLLQYFDQLKKELLTPDLQNLHEPDELIEDEEATTTQEDTYKECFGLGESESLNFDMAKSLLECSCENTTDYPIEATKKNLLQWSKFESPIVDPLVEINFNVTKYREANPGFEEQVLMRAIPTYINPNAEIDKPIDLPDLEPNSEMLVSLFIYRPFEFKYVAKNRSDNLRLRQEILLLGRNTLCDLRKKIICNIDEKVVAEVENTSVSLTEDPTETYPSGFFFIDNVFYNDMGAPNSVDYSACLIKWCKEFKITDVKSKNIENVTIDSFEVRFGYPYLYMHQGNCEHLVVFSDARLLHKDDCLHSICYPIVQQLNPRLNKLCTICTCYSAQWVCVDNDRLPQRMVFLCTSCCDSYNYIDGEKVGKFKLYPY